MNRSLPVRVAYLLAALGCCSALAWAETTLAELEEDHSLASQLVTPHKPWGRGYARGPVRALFVVHAGPYGGAWDDPGTRLRDVVELCQRLEVQADAVLFSGAEGRGAWDFHGQKLGGERAERLLARPYELYVVGGFPLERLPAKVQYLILAQVAQGAGLLYCGPQPCEYLTAKRRVDPGPPALTQGVPLLDGKEADEWATAYTMRAGRAVWLKYNAYTLAPRHDFSWRGLAEYDYWMLLVARAALWAAAREPEVAVDLATGGGALAWSPADTVGEAEVALTSSAPRPLPVAVALELRRACDGVKTDLGTVQATLTPGEPSRLPVALPRLRAGDYFLDAVVKSQRGVEAFAAEALSVGSDFGVESVEMDGSFVERGDLITGKVLLRGTPPPESVLRVRFRDSYDRVLRQEDLQVDPAQAEYPFEYRADEAATILMRVEAVLMVGGDEVEMQDTSFTVPKRRHGRLNFVMWDAPNDVLGYYAWRKLQEAGMDVALLGSMGGPKAQPAVLRACDASLVPYSTRILDAKDENGHMKPVCWNDEPAVTEYVQGIVDNQRQLREQGVFVYSLGDEGVTLGCCVHPACMAAYARYLADQYGTIDKLNASWDSEYQSFDEVDLLDRNDNMENAAAKTAYARWYDRQAFARFNLMQFSGRFVEAYRQLDPEALTGFEGTGNFGDDYDSILGINTFYGPYPSIGDDIIRSAAPRQLVRSNWMGYSKTADALSDAAWRMVMKGMDSIWFWMWDGIGTYRGYLSPTLDFWPATAELAEEMRPVRQGLGDLLLQSEMTHSGIAVFYSLPSALSGRLENGSQFVAPKTTHETWTQLTYDVGLDFRYVTSAMVKDGALHTGELKVLLLPMAQALGPEEAEAIQRFAREGGTVIADVRPGIYDDHCKPMMPGVLDDLFGIRRTGRGEPHEAALTLQASLEGRDLDLQLSRARVDTQIEAAGAEALAQADDTPALLVNHVGDGRAILLNFQLVMARPDDAEAAAARALLRALYDLAGARAAVVSTDPRGGPLPLTETRVWRNGDGLLFGLWRQMQCAWFNPKSGTVAGPPVAARIELASPSHVYDLRAGKYLGKVTRVDTRLRWGRANFFLALPYQIEGVGLRLMPEAPAPGDSLTGVIRLDVPAGAAEKHAVWVEVTDPQGERPLWGQRLVMLEGGTGRLELQVAYNDLPGRWRLKATELFSRASAEVAWTVP